MSREARRIGTPESEEPSLLRSIEERKRVCGPDRFANGVASSAAGSVTPRDDCKSLVRVLSSS
jgi:hypothetical protein